MIAVFLHELRSSFTGLMGFVFGALLLFFGGIYTMVYNLANALTNFEYVLGGMSFVFLIAVPLLTMRVLAEERKQRTDQLLYSLPVSMAEVVLGKFLALAVVFAIPMAVLSLYPVVLSAYGSIHFASAFGAVVGFFFLGLALIAIGVFVSSITESQAMSAGLCFLMMMVNYFIADLADFVSSSESASFIAFAVVLAFAVWVLYRLTGNGMVSVLVLLGGQAVLLLCYVLKSEAFAGLFPAVMEQLSLFERFYLFLDGIFDLTGIVYFLSVTAVFLFLSVQSMEKRRWSE